VLSSPRRGLFMPREAFEGGSPRSAPATSVAKGSHRDPVARTPAGDPAAPSTDRPPVLVLGRGLTTLGVVRALGRAGIPRYVVSAHPGPVRASRWHRRPPFRDYLYTPEDLAEYLHRSPIERGVLIPTSDADALAVARLPADLRERFPTSTADLEVLETLVDKGRLASLLEAHEVPHPRTVVIERASDLARVHDLEPDRAFVKPRDSQSFVERFGMKAFRPHGPLDLKAKLEWLTSRGIEVVVQEYVPGPPTNHYFVDGFMDARGAVRARLTRKRLRMFPLDFGNSSAVTTVDPEQVVPAVRGLETLLRGIGYRGVYSAEFKLD